MKISNSSLIELIPCDPSEPDKSQRVTAERIKELLQKIGVWNIVNRGQIQIIADHAIAGTIAFYLSRLGWNNTENAIYVCKSHTEQLFQKRTESEFGEIVANKDLNGKFKNMLTVFLIFSLEFCVNESEARKFVTNHTNYHQLHQRAPLKCKKSRTTLNKELERQSKLLKPIDKQKYMEKRVEWVYRMRAETKKPMSREEFDRSLRNLMSRKLRVTFKSCTDVHTFRSMCKRFQFFYTYVEMVMDVLNDNLDLKESVLDDRQFSFDPLFIESMAELNMVHSNLLSHYEKDSQIEFNSYWEMLDVLTDYCTNEKNKRLPLSDPMRV